MSEPESPDEQAEAPGWRVLDPDGNVVDSGPGIVLQAASATGDDPEEE